MMRWILDSCTLIYLIKANLFESFIKLVEYPVVIDSSVYNEVVIDGKAKGYSDAFDAEKSLKKLRIPMISIDVSSNLDLFRDPGETSCYILAKDEGICLTSDDRAYKKFIKQGQDVIRLDTFYFQKFMDDILSEKDFLKILGRLEAINATKPKSILFFMKKLKMEDNKK
jgi:hypothetical protein